MLSEAPTSVVSVISQSELQQDCPQHGIRTIAEIAPVVERFVSELAEAGFCERDIFGMRLAVEEAIVNGIKHGHCGDPSKQVRLRYAVTRHQVLVAIEDEGPGFDPDAVPDPLSAENLERPSGRGVFLMRCYMTSVQYNVRGNAVVMCKRAASK
jgi:serine/threonine-protein kinase RsbW